MARNPGPVPKRSEERIRRNIDVIPIEKVTAYGNVHQPPLAIDNAHPLVLDFYNSLGESAQSRYYEPSDWQYARLVLDTINTQLRRGGFSAAMFPAVMSALSNLLVTEGDRRRVRLEVERQNDEGGSVVDIAALLKQRNSG